MAATVEEEQPQDLPTAALAYKRVTFVNKMDDTAGVSGPLSLVREMTTWRPTVESGWYYLGQGASTYHTFLPPTPPSGVIVRALEDDALRDVTSWERVWTDEGSELNSKDYALWRGVPPNSDYAVIGGILSSSPNFAAPDSAQMYGIKAIRRDLLTINPVYKVTGIGTGAMIPTPSHNQPPEDMCLTLDPTKVLEITSSSTAEGDATTSSSADT